MRFFSLRAQMNMDKRSFKLHETLESNRKNTLTNFITDSKSFGYGLISPIVILFALLKSDIKLLFVTFSNNSMTVKKFIKIVTKAGIAHRMKDFGQKRISLMAIALSASARSKRFRNIITFLKWANIKTGLRNTSNQMISLYNLHHAATRFLVFSKNLLAIYAYRDQKKGSPGESPSPSMKAM